MNLLPVYIPKPPICHMRQYHYCKNHTDCRLYTICSKIKQQTVCQRDCPSCTYAGCSLSTEHRQINPVYINGVIQKNRVDLDIQGRYWREHAEHRKQHKRQYRFYNFLWGDLQQKNKDACRRKYYADLENSRKLRRDNYRKHHPEKQETNLIDEKFLPKCKLECDTCPLTDCNLPEDWREKALNRQRNERYRERHKERLAAAQKERRKRPEVKERRATYDRKYRKEHPESQRKKQRKYRESHPEKIRELNRSNYQKNKDAINAKRRKKRATERAQNQSTDCVA